MTTINLGNGGQYVNGHTYYDFKPYRGNDVGGSYRRVDIPGVGRRVWARLEDRGEDETGRTVGKGGDSVVLPRYSVCVIGWGSDTINSELHLDGDEMDAALFARLKSELS
ncbi:MAG TPA: hypothetical protein VN256_13010 [Pyrinomonadaceae bacterium]|nr:hypothetical protein [Pyrinomonadaceae bacterium]